MFGIKKPNLKAAETKLPKGKTKVKVGKGIPRIAGLGGLKL